MGIYDRDYFREQRPQHRLRGPRTVVGMLILINVVLFLANGLFTPPVAPEQLDRAFEAGDSLEELHQKSIGSITYHMAVKGSTLGKPLRWWQFLTYGFAHAPPPKYWHIEANMLVLFFLGRDIERRYGPREFLRLYLVMLVSTALYRHQILKQRDEGWFLLSKVFYRHSSWHARYPWQSLRSLLSLFPNRLQHDHYHHLQQ